MVEFKKCSGECSLIKEANKDNFRWRGDQNKFVNQCKICLQQKDKKYREEHKDERKEYDKLLYQENKNELNERNKRYYQKNKEELKEYQKQYRQENKEEIKKHKNIYKRNRRKNDIEYKLRVNISKSVWSILKHKKGGKSVLKHLPYTMEELKKYIEDQFEPWMTWDNWGVYNPKTHETNRTWQLDHIVAHSKFKYKTMDCQEFRDCWDLTNLQPLDSGENILKGDR